jgi:S1-C subfamily serine protease
LLSLLVAALFLRLSPTVPGEKEIELVVQKTLSEAVLPSAAARAYQVIQPSVVHVRGLEFPGAKDKDEENEGGSAGTGVLIVEDGRILTNLHVLSGATRIRVTFSDGSESEADLIAARPEKDLAVIKAHVVPAGLPPATMASTSGLSEGDQVIAVGYPFGIGPSISAGVISGFGREHRPPHGGPTLTDLIQFDTAVNPGNSGGPLVTPRGEVVGIVTGLLNPTGTPVFIGIAFAVPIEDAAPAAGLPPF